MSATVRQVIESLSALDPDLPVYLEGCDCYGQATGTTRVSPDYHDKLFVLLERGDD